MASFKLLLLCTMEYPIEYISITAFVISQELHFLHHIDLNQEATSVFSLGVLEGKLFEESCAQNFNVCEHNNQRKRSHQFEIQGLWECLEGRDLGGKEETEQGNYIIIF